MATYMSYNSFELNGKERRSYVRAPGSTSKRRNDAGDRPSPPTKDPEVASGYWVEKTSRSAIVQSEWNDIRTWLEFDPWAAVELSLCAVLRVINDE